jgi:hypothetical protein
VNEAGAVDQRSGDRIVGAAVPLPKLFLERTRIGVCRHRVESLAIAQHQIRAGKAARVGSGIDRVTMSKVYVHGPGARRHVLTLQVAIDWSLRSFILGFGPFAGVVSGVFMDKLAALVALGALDWAVIAFLISAPPPCGSFW